MNHECSPMDLISQNTGQRAVITQGLEQSTLSLSSGKETINIQINNCPFCGEILGKTEHKTPSWATGTY